MRADEWLKAMNIITKQIVRISLPLTARACFWISMHFKSSLSQSPSFLFWRSCRDCVAAAFQREFFHQADSICMQIAPFFNLELRSAIQSARDACARRNNRLVCASLARPLAESNEWNGRPDDDDDDNNTAHSLRLSASETDMEFYSSRCVIAYCGCRPDRMSDNPDSRKISTPWVKI